jgi:hypothetical protein
MYRWVTMYEHLVDNIQNGWLPTRRRIRFSRAASALLRKAFGPTKLKAAGAVVDAGTLTVSWYGISMTTSGPEEFGTANCEIFGRSGLQMTDQWLEGQSQRVPDYITDAKEDLARLLDTSADNPDALQRHLCGFDRKDLDGEKEIRVFVEPGRQRLRFSLLDIVGAFVSSHNDELRLRAEYPKLSVCHVPEPTLDSALEGLWPTEG